MFISKLTQVFCYFGSRSDLGLDIVPIPIGMNKRMKCAWREYHHLFEKLDVLILAKKNRHINNKILHVLNQYGEKT